MFTIHEFRKSEWVPRSASPHGCVLADVAVHYGDDTPPSFTGTLPCLSCSGFTFYRDYYEFAEAWLNLAIHHNTDAPRDRATATAQVVIRSLLGDYCFDCGGPCKGDTVLIVDVNVWPSTRDADESEAHRAVAESFEESEARPRLAKADAVAALYVGREEAEKRRRETEERECVICMDSIEKPMESLCMPCSHVFHEGCLKRWLCTSHVCQICRFRLPPSDDLEDSIDSLSLD